MKKLLVLALIGGPIFSSCSSNELNIKESDVPPNVVAALKAKYPSATVKKWQAEKEQVQFTQKLKEVLDQAR